MGWKISDILALLVTLFVSLNILISVISLSGKHLERRMDMGHLSLFLKMVLVFSAFGMPVLAGVILYKFVFGERIYLVSDDLLYMDTIHKGSISYGTPWGNHWIALLLFLAWFLGFIYYGIFKYANDRRILKKLEKCSKYTQDKLLIETKREAMNELGLKGPVLLLSNEIIQSPFMTGIFEQKIFLPESNYTQEEWGLLLKHELVHCKNQDYFFRRLVFILCALHWFNPPIYRLSDYFVEVNEMACDEKVLNRQPIKRHTMYAELILQIQEKELGLTTVSLTGHTVNGLERRIRNIMKKTEKTKRISFAVLAMSMVLMCPLTVFAASWGMSNLQDLVVKKLWITEVEVQQESTELPEKTEFHYSEDVIEYPIQINPRGVTSIDITIDGKNVKYGDSLSLTSGNKVAFILQSDSSSDSFKAGLEDSKGKRIYVQTSNGWIDHTFSIEQSGSYKIFLEGTTSKSIHITGSITILK